MLRLGCTHAPGNDKCKVSCSQVEKNIDLTRSKYRDQLERVESKRKQAEEYQIKVDTDQAAYDELERKLHIYSERKESEAGHYHAATESITTELQGRID